MSERPENKTGVVTYWNGRSGWIKLDDTIGKTTAESHDVCLRVEDIASGTPENGTAVSFWIDGDIARDVKIFSSGPLPPEPEPEPEPDSPPANSP